MKLSGVPTLDPTNDTRSFVHQVLSTKCLVSSREHDARASPCHLASLTLCQVYDFCSQSLVHQRKRQPVFGDVSATLNAPQYRPSGLGKLHVMSVSRYQHSAPVAVCQVPGTHMQTFSSVSWSQVVSKTSPGRFGKGRWVSTSLENVFHDRDDSTEACCTDAS